MLTLVFLIVSVFKLCGKETLLSKIILNVLCRRLPSSSDRPSRLVRTVSQPTEPPRPVLYISYFLSPANLQQSSVAFHLEDFQQLFVCTFDHPGFTSRQQDTKHTGSEQCEFDLQTDLLSISCVSQFSHGSCDFANSVLYIFYAVIISGDYTAQIHTHEGF